MDDVLLHGRTIEELHGKLESLLSFCREKNLKLKPSKLNISEEVEFGGAVISRNHKPRSVPRSGSWHTTAMSLK